MKFNRIVLVSILLLIFAIGAVSAADDNMTDTADEVLSAEPTEDLEVSPGDFAELSSLVSGTSSGETLKLEKDYVNSQSSTRVTISRAITIDGQGHTIDANGKSNIFHVNNNQVTLKNINFINGYSKNYSAVYGTCTIINCTFTDCTSEKNGGAIYNGNAYNSSFIGCDAYCGGAIYNGNAYNCSFKSCKARIWFSGDDPDYDGYGGAIYNGNAYDCSFINCFSVYGGAIYKGNAYNSSFDSCSVYSIWSFDFGGAIYKGDAHNCSFTNCNSFMCGGALASGSAYDCSFIKCESSTIGGAIYEGTAYNSSFNECSAGDGSAIYKGDAYNCSIVQCPFYEDNGVIIWKGNAYDCLFVNYTFNKKGIFIDGSYSDCTFMPITLSCSNLTVNYGEGGKLQIRSAEGINGVAVNVEIYKDNNLLNSFSTTTGSDLPIDAAPGNYIMALTSIGADPLNVSVTVNKGSPKLELANKFANPGEIANVKVAMSKKAAGYVKITINGETYRVQIQSGVASVDVPNLAEGAYTVKATYSGNAYHIAETMTDTFHVGKYTQGIEIETENFIIGETGKITAKMEKDTTGFVRFIIGEDTYKVAIKNGVASVDIDDLTEGTYSVTVKYGGNYKYNAETQTKTFDVTKALAGINITIKDIDGRETTSYYDFEKKYQFEARLPKDAAGFVRFILGNEIYKVQLSNGIAKVITSAGLNVGNHSISVKYAGNYKYSAETVTKTFQVTDQGAKLEAENFRVGETGRLTANLPKDAPGFVRFVIDGVTYKVELKNGVAYVDIDNLKEKTYSVTLKYGGNYKYDEIIITKTFTSSKSSPGINITANSIIVGETATIKVNVANDVPGNVWITVNGESHKVKIENGVATLTLSGLKLGTYDISVKYNGNYKYNAETKTASFNVSKASPELKVYKTTVDGKTVLTANIAEDATGYVNFAVNGGTYKAKIVNGVATLTLPDMAPETYTLKSSYGGNYKYLPETKTRTITIK